MKPNQKISLFFLLLLAFCWPFSSFAKSVLVLNSYHETFPWTDNLVKGMKTVLQAAPHDIELFVEYMDTKRTKPEPQYLDKLEALYYEKHAKHTFDAVITTDNNALNFLVDRYNRLFPNTPVVFCGVNNFTPSLLKGNQNITGVVESPDIKGTINLAKRLHPNLNKIIVITDDTPTGIMNRSIASKYLNTLKMLSITYINGTNCSLDEAIALLKKAPKDSIVLFLDFWRDKTGAFFSSRHVIPLFSRVSPVPTYSHNDLYLSPRGIVGGKLNAGFYHGTAVADLVLKVLTGAHPKDVPIDLQSPSKHIVDYVQLKKFRINNKRLPLGTIVKNKPFSIYETYKGPIWATSLVISVLLLLIAFLSHNIVKRKQAERELSKEQARLLAMFEAANTVAFITYGLSKERHTVTDFSPGAETIFGYERDEAIGGSIALFSTSNSSLNQLEELLANNPHGYTRELSLLRKNGELFDGLVTTHPLLDGEDNIVAALDVVIDLTEQKKAEAEQKRLEAQVRHSQKLKSLGILAGGIAHDFNNLLMAIHGNTELAISEESHSQATQKCLEEILTASKRASELTNQLLAYSGRSQVVKSAVQINELVREMGELLSVSKSQKAEIRFELDQDLDVVEADVGQIRQVVMNLVTNASEAIGDQEGVITIKTTPYEHEGGLVAQSYVEEPLATGSYIAISVTDTGCGMDAEALSRLFEPFYTTKFTGRGLGLAAVLGIVRSHGGAICITSIVGEGTTFRVLLPTSPDSDQKAHQEERARERYDLTGLTFLVADDELVVREVAARMLEKAGAAVVKAADGREALDLFAQEPNKFDGLLFDVTMPRMDGPEAAEAVLEIRPNTPIVFASGYPAEDSVKFFGEGQRPFIQKPFEFETLVGLLHSLTVID